MATTPEIYLIFNTPYFMVVGVILIAVLLSFIAAPLYRMELNQGYGKEFRKLDNLIEDMEILRR